MTLNQNVGNNTRLVEYENLKKVNQKFFDRYTKTFEEFINSGWYILGNSVKKFENDFAKYCNAKRCVGLASGLDALILALDALDLQTDDEVIVPSNTYIATILAIIRNGLKPVLVEPDIHTYNIDPKKIVEKISSKTKVIMVVHLYGKVCKMDEILAIADAHHLKVIEDVAQAHGAKFKGTKAGVFGDFGAFSFYPTKNLGALGDAGALTMNNNDYYEKIFALRNYGSFKKYYNEYVGYNSRLDEIQAALLSEKLNFLDEINNHKRSLADYYNKNISTKFIKPVVDSDYHDVYHIYNIRHTDRDNLKEYLKQNGITTEIHYPVPPHEQKAMKGIIDGKYPISEEIHSTTLSLPISYFHTLEDVIYVTEVLNRF